VESDDGGSQGPIHNFLVEPPQRLGRKTGDARRADGTRGPSAVLVVHGVGQQTKFETLDSLVRGLVRTILPAPLDHPRARLVQLAGERLNRVELRFKREGRESEIHLYEGYWASITEGRVTRGGTWRPPSRS